jgi:maltose alpha-D-glucosyltransferase/alpha-amylase
MRDAMLSGCTDGKLEASRRGDVHDWYRRAVFYELSVRTFFDADGDGVGDLRGVLEKLDHLEWLGVDCLWLLPIYPSPLRDGGYDVADFTSIRPDCGSMEDFERLLHEVHRRGMRMITDLVLNHTSDQHAWFQESRQDRTNRKADWYVWSDDPHTWSEARIIFHDTERSNWEWDPLRQQYYWHRFFSHQPDLNFDNPEVCDAMLDVARYWLDLGVDGFRLDAVPYLYERNGTGGENVPETHAYLKRFRSEVEAARPGAVLFAEANQWPTEVVDYFGSGDECHLCFHFPLMPRLFMGVKQGTSQPIIEILARTPRIPDSCQWAIFLRNHDELTLEMVTDEEWSFMNEAFAPDPRMRCNAGIRRRLAPLVDNDRRTIELLHALLLSLPGSPVLYYGDEIGMGDNIWLSDRYGVRTPMQWGPGPNGDFSRADFTVLDPPPLVNVVYGFESVNVEAQRRDASSFLNRLRALLEVRRRHTAFATGTFRAVAGRNPAILAYLREDHADTILCVNNLSSSPQSTDLDLSLESCDGVVLAGLLGEERFPPIGPAPYRLSLSGHGFYWFRLLPADADATVRHA